MSAVPMSSGGTMRVSVVSPEQVLYEGDASSVVAPAYDGQVGILPRHAPFMALLGEGTLAIRNGGEESRFGVSRGFIQVVGNVVRVVAERAQPATV